MRSQAFPVSNFDFRVSNLRFPISIFEFPISSFEFRVSLLEWTAVMNGIRVPVSARRKMATGIEAGADRMAGVLRALPALCSQSERAHGRVFAGTKPLREPSTPRRARRFVNIGAAGILMPKAIEHGSCG